MEHRGEKKLPKSDRLARQNTPASRGKGSDPAAPAKVKQDEDFRILESSDAADELMLQPLEAEAIFPLEEADAGFELLPDDLSTNEAGTLEPLADFAKMSFDDEPLADEAVVDLGAIPEAASPSATNPNAGHVVATALQPPVAVEVLETSEGSDDEPVVVHRNKFLLNAVPSWLISLFVHVAIILILAAVTLDPTNKVISILQASVSEVVTDIENFDLQGPTFDSVDMSMDEPLSVPTPSITPVVSVPKLESPMLPDFSADVESLEMNALTESIMPTSLLNSSAMAQMSVALNSRSSAQKSEMLEKFGGNAASEKSVAMALKWLADHQARNGGWTFAHNTVCRNQCGDPGDLALATNGATAMALLPFLGAGQTHVEGQYKNTVKAGLSFLINRMKVENKGLPAGSWHEPGGRMYSHGLAAITVCEAYAMTQDPDLLQPAQLSLNYLINSQDPRGGGWRYEPGQPGDTSVVGWCVMALKSGKMGHLIVPQQTFQKANNFLDFVSTNQGAYYGYDEPSAKARHATTSVGLLCRMYMGVPKEHPGIKAGVEYLGKRGPSTSDLYYTYYATQVMRHHGGPEWEKWNTKLRDDLIKLQVKEGHAAGSWYTEGGHSDKGGRLYATSLATMILEVYYRHMPLYSEKSSDDDFEI